MSSLQLKGILKNLDEVEKIKQNSSSKQNAIQLQKYRYSKKCVKFIQISHFYY